MWKKASLGLLGLSLAAPWAFAADQNIHNDVARSTSGHRTYSSDLDDVDYAQTRQGNTRVYYSDRPSDVRVERYYESSPGRVESRTTYYYDSTGRPYYYGDGGRVIYVSPGAVSDQGNVHYNASLDSAYDVHTHRNRDSRSDGRTVYVDRDRDVTVYGNADQPVRVERREVVYQRPVYSGNNLKFRGELVGLNRVWSAAHNSYADVATIREASGNLIDFHVDNWRDLELNNFKLGDQVTITADGKDLNGRNVLSFKEINRR